MADRHESIDFDTTVLHNDTMNQTPQGIQVIARAAAILRLLGKETDGLSLGQIAQRLGLPRSTVQRIVGSLAAERLVISGGKGGDIRLGPEIAALASATRASIVELCRPHLVALSQRVGETVDLSVLRGASMIFLDQVAGTHRLRTVSAIGDVFPLTDTANGRAVLAAMGREAAGDLAQAEWRRRAMASNWHSFSALLDRVGQSGLAYDQDEHTTGISAIGAAFRDASGDFYAVSVPIPSSRFVEKRAAVEQALADTVSGIARVLGSP